jgi:hypothetical protein
VKAAKDADRLSRVDALVAIDTQGDQVFIRVTALVAAELNVVDLECIHATAVLAAPTIPLQDCDP